MPKNKGKGKNRQRGNNENDVSENFCSCGIISDEFDEKVLVPQSHR